MHAHDYVILIGAPKCGTTTLASWLGMQDGITVSRPKETMFFTDHAERDWERRTAGHHATRIVRTEAAFEACFGENPDRPVRIEASTDNMSCQVTADRLATFAERSSVRSLRLLAITRDPVERIVSEWEHTLRMGWNVGTLLESLRAEEDRRARNFHPLFYHVERSRYFSQLKPFRERFGEALKIIDFHRIGEDEVLFDIAAFAGFAVTTLHVEHKNKRDVPVRPLVSRWLRKKSVLRLGHALVPKGLRGLVRSTLEGGRRTRYEPKRQELDFIAERLGDEIRACIADPLIPTGHWQTARQLVG